MFRGEDSRSRRRFFRSAIRDRDAEAQRRVGQRESTNLIVDQAGGFCGGDYVNFANILLAFGIDHPDGAVRLDCLGQCAETAQIFCRFGREENQVGVFRQPAARIFWDSSGQFDQEFSAFDAEDRNELTRLDAKLIDQQPMGIIAFRCSRLPRFFNGH